MNPLLNSPQHPSSRPEAKAVVGCCNQRTLAAVVLTEARSVKPPCRQRLGASLTAMGSLAVSFEVVVLAYEDGRWADAFAAANWLADRGDPRAAKLALLMLRWGSAIYGVTFSTDPRRVACWAKQVLQAKADRREALAAGPDPWLLVDMSPSPPTPAQRDPRSTSRRTASPSSITAIA